MSRKWIRAVLLLAGAVLTLVLTAATVPAAPPGGKLSKEERAAISKARAEGKSTVTMLFATQPGQAKTVVDGLQGLGAKVGYRDDQLGYVRAAVELDKVAQAMALAGVAAADIDQVVPMPDPRPDNISPIVPFAAPSAATPRVNPYMPT